jgi:thiol:disulfide interchange protein DsbC
MSMSSGVRAASATLAITAILAAAPSLSPSAPAKSGPGEASTPVEARAPRPVLEKIVATLRERIPDLAVLDVYTSPVPGLYEVLASDGLIYIDATGDHILMGPLIATQGRKNLTEQRFGELTRVDFAALPFGLAIKEVRGNGTRQIAVFADPKCPYCQELEGQLGKIDDLTVYTFLYPGATGQAHQIWCAADRVGAWTAWMRSRQEVPAAPSDCSADPIKQIDGLGHKLHLNTTPTVFFESGRRITGTVSPAQFQHLLATESSHLPTTDAKPGS